MLSVHAPTEDKDEMQNRKTKQKKRDEVEQDLNI
jgi:hypothetical protein